MQTHAGYSSDEKLNSVLNNIFVFVLHCFTVFPTYSYIANMLCYVTSMFYCVCVCVLHSGVDGSTLHSMTSIPTMNVDFDAVFGTKASNTGVKPSAGKLSPECVINNCAS